MLLLSNRSIISRIYYYIVVELSSTLLSTTYKIWSNICKLLGTISMDFDITNQAMLQLRRLTDILCWWSETSQNCGTNGHIVHPPGDMLAWRAKAIVKPAGKNSWLIHQSSLANLPVVIWEQAEGMDEEVRVFSYPVSEIPHELFNMP
jgi:hypothetical protein